MESLIVAAIVLQVITLVALALVWRKSGWGNQQQLGLQLSSLDQGIGQKLMAATAEMAKRLEETKGDLRQQLSDRLTDGFGQVRSSVEAQLAAGRGEQAERLAGSTRDLEGKFEALRGTTEAKLEAFAQRQAESMDRITKGLESKFDELTGKQTRSLADARTELSSSLNQATATLKTDFVNLTDATSKSLESIRVQVDHKLGQITEQVQTKLDQNIKEGFAQFEKVQHHLQAAEEQLRNVGALGHSINDLNNLLKLPHLRGKFGEASLERLLADFLPANMYEIQTPLNGGAMRPDAVLVMPDGRKLPIDSKFPREQVLPLFESSDAADLIEARKRLISAVKEQARRVMNYIQPGNGTTDMAMIYFPSETLYIEAVRSGELTEYLNANRIFATSPNTLMNMLQAIHSIYKWYQVAKSFEKTTEELGKARKHFEMFENKFDAIGKSLEKAQEAYGHAATHLTRYRKRVTSLTGDTGAELELEFDQGAGQKGLAAGAGE